MGGRTGYSDALREKIGGLEKEGKRGDYLSHFHRESHLFSPAGPGAVGSGCGLSYIVRFLVPSGHTIGHLPGR